MLSSCMLWFAELYYWLWYMIILGQCQLIVLWLKRHWGDSLSFQTLRALERRLTNSIKRVCLLLMARWVLLQSWWIQLSVRQAHTVHSTVSRELLDMIVKEHCTGMYANILAVHLSFHITMEKPSEVCRMICALTSGWQVLYARVFICYYRMLATSPS